MISPTGTFPLRRSGTGIAVKELNNILATIDALSAPNSASDLSWKALTTRTSRNVYRGAKKGTDVRTRETDPRCNRKPSTPFFLEPSVLLVFIRDEFWRRGLVMLVGVLRNNLVGFPPQPFRLDIHDELVSDLGRGNSLGIMERPMRIELTPEPWQG